MLPSLNDLIKSAAERKPPKQKPVHRQTFEEFCAELDKELEAQYQEMLEWDRKYGFTYEPGARPVEEGGNYGETET